VDRGQFSSSVSKMRSDRIFKGEALLNDNRLREPGLVEAQMRDQGLAGTLVNHLATFGSALKPFHGTGDEPMVVGPWRSAAGIPNDLVLRHIPPLARLDW